MTTHLSIFQGAAALGQKRIWALLDERAGNSGQILGVADALGLEYEVKHIRFNPLIRLPNPLLWWNWLGITSETRQILNPPWPDITVTSARRLGLVAAYIKRRHPSTFTAQIQWPGYTGVKLDLIATPRHDDIPAGGNVMLTLGAPHQITPLRLARESEAWQPILAYLPSPRIAVLLGGSSDPVAFAQAHGEKLASLTGRLAASFGGSLLITSSRRTGTEMPSKMKEYLSCPYHMYEWRQASPAGPNPYFGFLGLAEAIIVTGDSVSMCSEACATGKPVFIYEGEGFMSRKHKAFIQALYADNLAQPLQGDETLYTPGYRLDDAAAVALEIRKRIGL